jgi:subtilase family serine protease
MLHLRLPSVKALFSWTREKKTASLCSPQSPMIHALPILEELESRHLLSVAGVVVAAGLTATPQPSPNASGSGSFVYTPAQIRAAYGFNQLSETGEGQTIAIVDAYDDPNLASDVAVFDQNFNLTGQSVAGVNSFLTKVNEFGNSSTATLPQANRSWSLEITLDVEWAHAIAPAAKILLVEASSSGTADLLTAVNTARFTSGVSVVSMSWGSNEFAGETGYDSYFATPAGHIGGNGQVGGITFVASSGDGGAGNGPEWPSVSTNVLAVGGTSLTLSGSSYVSETAWSDGGGGYSKYVTRPSFQVGANNIPWRSTPDVSYDANPNTGFYLYSTYLPGGSTGWFQVGGTSAGAPQWAALIALANQGRSAEGLSSLYGAQTNVYALPKSDFHDITSGNNGYQAGTGYDAATGLGTPYANLVVQGLLAVPNPPASSPGSGPGSHPFAPAGEHSPDGLAGGSAGIFSPAANLSQGYVSSSAWIWAILASQSQQQGQASNPQPTFLAATQTNANSPARSLMQTPGNAGGHHLPAPDAWSEWQEHRADSTAESTAEVETDSSGS